MYAKVFRALWDGSLYGKSDAQLVFIYLLAHTDQDGYACEPAPTIAVRTGLSLRRVRNAIEVLEAPDLASKSSESEGRRLARTIPERDEWFVVNYSKYRSVRNDVDRREQNRLAQQRRRSKFSSASVSQGQPLSAQGEGEGEVDVEAEVRSKPLFKSPRVRSAGGRVEDPSFAGWYSVFPRHVARFAASKAYTAALRKGASPETLLRAVGRYAEDCRSTEPDKIKHPATWLNGGCWLDEPAPIKAISDAELDPHAEANRIARQARERMAANAQR